MAEENKSPVSSQQYYVIPSSEKEVDKRGYMQYSVESGVKTMDEAELKEYYESEDNKLLRQTFSDFNTYRDYMAEKSALYDSGVLDKWWEVTEEQEQEFADTMFDAPDSVTNAEEFGEFLSSQGAFGVTQDPSGGYITDAVTGLMSPEEKAAYESQQIQDYKETGAYQNSRYNQYNAQAEQEVLQALNEKYGAPSRMGESITDSDGSKYQWTGDGYIKVADPPEESLLGMAVQIAVMTGIGMATGAGVAGAINSATAAGNALATSIGQSLGGLQATTISAAAGGMAGSAAVQTLMTGSIDPLKLVQAGLTAGILDVANGLSNMDPELATSATLGAIDDKINAIADVLGTSYDTALNIAKGVSVGVINEGDLEGIVINAASTLGADKIVNYIEDNIGLAVPNLFQEGTTDISPDAVEEVSRVFLKDVLSGDLSPETLLDAGIGYVRNDGSLAPIDPGILEGLRDKLPEASFSDLLPDFELISGADFDIDFVKGEDRPFDAEDPFAKVNDEDPSDVVQFKYDQGVVDAITGVIEDVRETGREIDDEVLQPVKEALEAGGRAVDDTVLQPVKEFIEAGGRAIDDTVLQPVKEFIEEILPESPESPEGIEGIGGSGIDLDVDLKIPEFKGSKPFGENLKQMAPLSAPRLAPGVEIFGKAQVNAPYDPTRAGSPITAGLFSEYIG